MNLNASPIPLPIDWHPDSNRQPRRRRCVGALSFSPCTLEGLNAALRASDPRRRQVCADQIASGARRLLAEQRDDLPMPLGIYDRVRRIGLLRAMIGDDQWQIDERAANPAQAVLDYTLRHEELIPHDAPVIGHFDDAILVDAAWPNLAPEVACYLDYRRLRRLESEARDGDGRFRFDRRDWLEAREGERRLLRHLRDRALGHFASGGTEFFRVH